MHVILIMILSLACDPSDSPATYDPTRSRLSSLLPLGTGRLSSGDALV